MKWLFNSYMVWGAVLRFLIFSGINGIQDTWNHEGPGYVFYDEPERTKELIPENEYKRNKYVSNSFMVLLGLILWVIVARSDNNTKNPDKSL